MLKPFSVAPITIPTPFAKFGEPSKQSVCLAGCENDRVSERVLAALSKPKSELIRDHWDAQDLSLRAKLAELHGVDTDQVVLTSGALAAIDYTFKVFVDQRATVGLLTPDFPGFRFYADYSRARVKRLEKMEFPFTPSMDEIIDFVRKSSVDFFIFSNPSAATGTRFSVADIYALLEACPDTLIVVDEADAIDTVSAAALTKNHANLLVLRSFSKFYGLSGLRIGYLVTPSAYHGAFVDTVDPIGLTSFAILAASTVLDDMEYQHATQKRVEENRRTLEEACGGTPFRVVPGSECFACYLWANDDIEDPYALLARHGIDIAAAKTFGLPRGGRVNVSGTGNVRILADFLKSSHG